MTDEPENGWRVARCRWPNCEQPVMMINDIYCLQHAKKMRRYNEWLEGVMGNTGGSDE